MKQLIFILLSVLSTSCDDESKSDNLIIEESAVADVTKVSTSGTVNNYTFLVTISSPDTGCEQYADWWEVVSESGDLLYRRILLHSHVSEQPFSRSGGTVDISEDEIVWVRVHMNNEGYGGQAMKGSVKSGFDAAQFPEMLGTDLDQIEPLPSGCAF